MPPDNSVITRRDCTTLASCSVSETCLFIVTYTNIYFKAGFIIMRKNLNTKTFPWFETNFQEKFILCWSFIKDHQQIVQTNIYFICTRSKKNHRKLIINVNFIKGKAV